ncbi:hypothetical protein [Candidatus Spyradosoma sp. SGI.093]|uniref:hypothetical protein n=1 Tax=Candidatus Spyradosoma sp. SGI.093 TaxID=3420583 RepID=UPI003CFDDDE8
MKSKISLVLFCAAAGVPAFAISSTVSYIDENGAPQNISFDSSWSNEGKVSQVEISVHPNYVYDPEHDYSYVVAAEIYNYGTIEGLTLSSAEDGAKANFTSFSGSTLCGNISISSGSEEWQLHNIYGSIGAGTRFSVNGTLNALYLHGERWDISAEDAASDVALISGDGYLGMNPRTTLTLNFVTEEALKSTDSLNLISGTISLKGGVLREFRGDRHRGGRRRALRLRSEPGPGHGERGFRQGADFADSGAVVVRAAGGRFRARALRLPPPSSFPLIFGTANFRE